MKRMVLMFPLLGMIASPTVSSAEPHARLSILANRDAWQRLPGAPKEEQPLPAWARILAGKMPVTTARMLELDAMHRSGDRLDARLRCLVRWAAADANGCEYSKAMAVSDLRRSRDADADLKALVNNPEQLPELDRAAVAFARKMMREAHAVTDDEVQQLLKLAGEERLVAIVTLLAHASFQDRVFLALNIVPENGDGVPPVSAKFGRPAPAHPAEPKPPPKISVTSKNDAGWLRLQQGLDSQRKRVGRIRVPSREEVLRRIGAKHPAAWQADILWSRVCYGNQPELTQAWFDCATAFRQEGGLDPLLSNSIFWVVTDAVLCFY